MADNYPVDMNAAKNSILFKKFIQGRNKSYTSTTPKMSDVKVTLKQNKIDSGNESFDDLNRKTVHTSQGKQSHQITEEKEREYVRGIINTKPEQFSVQEYRRIQKIEKVQEFEPNSYKQQKVQKLQTNPQFKQEIEQQQSKKYRKLLQDYQELKQTLLQQRKKYLKEHYILQQEIQNFKKKNFQVRMHQDELIHENTKLKEKLSYESRVNLNLQEENKEIGYKIQQMEDMLDGKENAIKKRTQQLQYWKNTSQNLRQEINNLSFNNERLEDECYSLQRQLQGTKKQKGNKDLHVNDMREKINELIHQNGLLKDEIYNITCKLYHSEQENQSLRADLRRDNDRFPIDFLQEQIKKKPEIQIEKSHEFINRKQYIPENDGKKNQRRRGQFAKQRANKTNTHKIQSKQNSQQKGIEKQIPNKAQVQQKKERLRFIQKQLQRIGDMKAINGSIRRQKITLEREMLEIQAFFKEVQETF